MLYFVTCIFFCWFCLIVWFEQHDWGSEREKQSTDVVKKILWISIVGMLFTIGWAQKLDSKVLIVYIVSGIDLILHYMGDVQYLHVVLSMYGQ